MLFEKYLMPDLMLSRFSDLTPETVKGFNAKVILSDIDNTLVTYDDPVPTKEVLEWLKNMNDNGITVAFVSNNSAERVDKFCENTDIVHVSDAGKPKTKSLKAACKMLGVNKSEAMFFGDQLLTDCWAGKSFGIPAVIVPPIKDKLNLFFRFKRFIEKPYVKKYKKIHNMK